MCAIVDANVGHEVFDPSRQTEAGRFFYDWLMRPNGGTMVAGGNLLRELNRSEAFRRFFGERLLANRARRIPDEPIAQAEDGIRRERLNDSNDEHVLALAQVTGARLLFTNDHALQQDFQNREIITGTRGRIYTTVERNDLRRTHRDLLRRSDLCAA